VNDHSQMTARYFKSVNSWQSNSRIGSSSITALIMFMYLRHFLSSLQPLNHPTPTMVYIIAIPLFYQASSYAFPLSSDHPTTTARYIALLPTSDPILQDRDYAIAKDAVAWGWKVYDTDPELPKMKAWWKTYTNTVSKKSCTWDDDLWRIWQREHGVRILGKDLKLKGKAGGSVSAMQMALGGLKKAGLRIKRSVIGREAVEWELRQLEERKRELRVREKRSKAAKVEWANANATQGAAGSTISLPGSFTERLERFDLGKTSGNEGGVGSADIATVPSAARSRDVDAVVLPRHSWLYPKGHHIFGGLGV
jgi:hypothetical protein